jgi:hypothetical protein
MAHEGLIERTRETRFAAGNRAGVNAYRCGWCAKPALRGMQWCNRHQPGLASHRRERKASPEFGSRIGAIAREVWTEKTMPPEFLAWPPLARIVSHRPRHTRTVTVAETMQALVWQSHGRLEPWAELVSRLRAAGLYHPTDPTLAEFLSLGRC